MPFCLMGNDAILVHPGKFDFFLHLVFVKVFVKCFAFKHNNLARTYYLVKLFWGFVMLKCLIFEVVVSD